ncbi:CPXCG motif-containing cysteine-rich protein [Congregibacter litoralis]|uniref:Cysteine-rich CPXCG n=1 Tax=Congregibacter litoralis KT71 TaxID=314285 RepID=A4A7H8_9GAMM|nr:CPXCG motif-containing cysteine-rich protein [Congregibacter litoralis]EAQ98247.1 Cysteine-rich CPXCG [Congregibacter litoralis KT71]
MELQESQVFCPYCGEPLTILLDSEDSDAEYIEDCQVCCQPMVVTLMSESDGSLSASVRREDE